MQSNDRTTRNIFLIILILLLIWASPYFLMQTDYRIVAAGLAFIAVAMAIILYLLIRFNKDHEDEYDEYEE